MRRPQTRRAVESPRARAWAFDVGIVVVVFVLAGCDRDGAPAAQPVAPSATGAPSPQSGGGGSAGAPEAAGGIPAELVRKVDALVRLTAEYDELAAGVTDVESYKRHRDELSRIENELAPVVEDVMIGEAKLTAAEKARFQREHYEARARPLVEARAAHRRRIDQLLPR